MFENLDNLKTLYGDKVFNIQIIFGIGKNIVKDYTWTISQIPTQLDKLLELDEEVSMWYSNTIQYNNTCCNPDIYTRYLYLDLVICEQNCKIEYNLKIKPEPLDKSVKTYKSNIFKVNDDDDDNIKLQIIINKNNIEAFDSKGRYFCVKLLKENFYDYYIKKINNSKIRYDIFEDSRSICIEGDGWNDEIVLEEEKDSTYHLQTINKKIKEMECHIKILNEHKMDIKNLYSFHIL